MTRSELAWRSSLAKPTVSFLVDMLIDQGVAIEAGSAQGHPKGGPRGRLIALNPEATAIIGIHLGVRETTIALAGALGDVRTIRTVGPYRGDAERALQDLPGLVAVLLQDADVPTSRLGGVGVAVPGLVTRGTGHCVLAPNLGWKDVAVRAALSASMGVPVQVCNSVQAGGIAELYLGGHDQDASFVWIAIDDGIGAAIVTDGCVLFGKKGYAGEFGHWKLGVSDLPCSCGQVGCLETVASGRAIEATARELASKTGEQLSFALDSRSIAAAASAGDLKAQAVLEKPGFQLGRGIANLVDLLNVEMVVLDGPIIRAGDFLVEVIRASFASNTVNAEAVPIVRSRVAGDLVLQGAVFVGLEASGACHRLGRARSAHPGQS